MKSAVAVRHGPAVVSDLKPQLVRRKPDQARPWRGLGFGLVVALLFSLLWGLLAYELQPFLIALLIGYALSLAIERAAGRLSFLTSLSAFLLGVTAIIAGDIFYFSFDAMQELGIAFSFDLWWGHARDIFALEELDNNLFFCLTAVFCGVLLAYYRARWLASRR